MQFWNDRIICTVTALKIKIVLKLIRDEIKSWFIFQGPVKVILQPNILTILSSSGLFTCIFI